MFIAKNTDIFLMKSIYKGKVALKKVTIGLLILGMFQVGHAYSAGAMANTVIFAGVNSGGDVFVELANPINEQGCVGVQLIIPSDSEIKDKILSIALTAKSTASPIVVKTNGCHAGSPAILKTAAEGGYFYVM